MMRLILVVLFATLAVCSAQDSASASGTDTGSAEGSGAASAGGGASADTNNNVETTAGVEATASATQTGKSAAATGAAAGDVTVAAPSGIKQTKTSVVTEATPFTTPFIGTGEDVSPGFRTPSPSPSPSPSTTPTPTTTSPPDECPEGPKRCNHCEQEGFNGFSFAPGKCDCCPWPCCCKCVQIEGAPPECSRLLDLGIILDASGSIGSSDWIEAKDFLNVVASWLPEIGSDQHVAMVTFSTDAKLQWDFNGAETSSSADLVAAISGLQRVGQYTNTAKAIRIANNKVFVPSGGDDPAANNVALLVTDGRTNFGRDDMPALAAELRSKASTLCVGVTGKVDKDELLLVCDEDRIFMVAEFKDLKKILNRLHTKICPTPPSEERCFCCCSPEQYWGAQGFW